MTSMTFSDFLGTVFTTSVTVVVIGLGIVGTFAFITKPDEAMLRKDIVSSCNSQFTSGHILDKAMSGIALSVSTINIKDFVVAKYAEVILPNGEKREYYGYFQKWHMKFLGYN